MAVIVSRKEICCMEIKRIKQADDELYKKAIALYGMSFPPHEQREADSQKRILEQDAYPDIETKITE